MNSTETFIDGWDGISNEGDGIYIEGDGIAIDINPIRL